MKTIYRDPFGNTLSEEEYLLHMECARGDYAMSDDDYWASIDDEYVASLFSQERADHDDEEERRFGVAPF